MFAKTSTQSLWPSHRGLWILATYSTLSQGGSITGWVAVGLGGWVASLGPPPTSISWAISGLGPFTGAKFPFASPFQVPWVGGCCTGVYPGRWQIDTPSGRGGAGSHQQLPLIGLPPPRLCLGLEQLCVGHAATASMTDMATVSVTALGHPATGPAPASAPSCALQVLASALKTNWTLERLHLAANQIMQEGATALANALCFKKVPLKEVQALSEGQSPWVQRGPAEGERPCGSLWFWGSLLDPSWVSLPLGPRRWAPVGSLFHCRGRPRSPPQTATTAAERGPRLPGPPANAAVASVLGWMEDTAGPCCSLTHPTLCTGPHPLCLQISLARNGIGDLPCSMLAMALGRNQRLCTLDLSFCGIGTWPTPTPALLIASTRY